MARSPPVLPSQMDSDQKAVYDKAFITCQRTLRNRFNWMNDDGALIGPLSILMHTPHLARLYLQFASELGKIDGLPKRSREVAIVATGGVFESRYELYAHECLAAATGLNDAQIEAVRHGNKPTGDDALDEQCEIARELASELLVKKGPLSEEVWNKARTKFGEEGTRALIHYVAFYAYTCIILNAIDEPVP